MIRVLLVDDQPLVRAGLRTLLDEEEDIDVAGDASNGEEAISAVAALNPNVVLMDIRMPVLDGLEATRRLTALGCAARIVILTTFDVDEYVFQALRSGASGFLLKDATGDEIVRAVRVAAAGDARSSSAGKPLSVKNMAPPCVRRITPRSFQ